MLLFVPSSVIFAEEIHAETCNLHIDDVSDFPHSRNAICNVKQYCTGGSWPLYSDEEIIIKKDYIVKQFLYTHPDVSLEDAVAVSKNNRFFTDAWLIPDQINYEDPRLVVAFDTCGNITAYSYASDQSEGNTVRAEYPFNDRIIEDIKIFEESKYNVIKTIMQRHPPPAIQVNEFNILLNEIHCNEELESYIRDNTIPVCLKEHTYETLLERGFNLH